MSKYHFTKISTVSVFTSSLAVLLIPVFVYGAVMGSGSYSIQSDSLNIGGTDSSSASYSGQDTIGETSTGSSTSVSYGLIAGYQQMQSGSISITSPADPTFSNMSGIAAGEANTSSVWTVTTDNSAGYTLAVKASTNPAMKSSTFGSFFSDYTPSGANPDKTFSIASTISAFAFSPEGGHIVQRYKDNGSSCNTGSSDTIDACWDGFTTSDVNIASSATSNSPSGTATTIKYKVAVGSDKIQDSGAYSATITVTATTI
jgi:hypothetical protein